MSEIIELARVSRDVDAPIARMWARLSDFAGIDKLLPPGGPEGIPHAEKVVMEGEGIGAVRHVYLSSGTCGIERLDELDAVGHRMTYTALPSDALPLADYQATLTLEDLGHDRTRATYSGRGRLQGATLGQVESALLGFYNALIDTAARPEA